jgi:hypothetical protein
MENQPVERKKVCPNCGETFSCFSDNCWCSKLPNIMPMEEARGCLCPKCLEVTIQEKIEQATPEQKELLLKK